MEENASHNPFDFPDNPEAYIWRYMDISKFMALVLWKSIYFPRIDVLRKADPYEATLPKANFDAEMVYNPAQMGWKKHEHERVKKKYGPWLKRAWGEVVDETASTSFASCWHMNQQQSAAMWRLYLKSDDGIAIRSTARRLQTALECYNIINKGDQKGFMKIGMMRYINFDKMPINYISHLNFVTHKRMSYEHERELRAIFWRVFDEGKEKVVEELGLNFKVDLNVLIESIFVAPTADDLTYRLVKEVKKRHRLKAPVVKSDLYSDPMK